MLVQQEQQLAPWHKLPACKAGACMGSYEGPCNLVMIGCLAKINHCFYEASTQFKQVGKCTSITSLCFCNEYIDHKKGEGGGD